MLDEASSAGLPIRGLMLLIDASCGSVAARKISSEGTGRSLLKPHLVIIKLAQEDNDLSDRNMLFLRLFSPLRYSQLQNAGRSCHINPLKLRQQALYHSYEHPSSPPYSSTAESILSASVTQIPQHGFTQKALQLGAQDAGFMSISTNLLPRGVFDLIAYYLMTKRLALQNSVNGENGYAKAWAESKTGVGSRVRSLLLERLNMNVKAGVVKKWPEVSIILHFHDRFHFPAGSGLKIYFLPLLPK
jgi:hypothetical protein